jgi:hypothetical protein
MPVQQLHRVVNRRRLEQFERRHHVANYCHKVLLEWANWIIW